MKTNIYFYTGTGNSLWAARRIAEELGDTDLYPISKNNAPDKCEITGLVFPVHIWGVPGKVVRFLNSFTKDTSKYYFAVAVNAGQVAATLIQLKKLMKAGGINLSAGYDLIMPSNYIPWGGPGPEEKWRERIRKADEKIKKIAADIAQKKELPVEKGPIWQNVLFSMLYRLSVNSVSKLDKNFWIDEKCNSCGICEKVCPAQNIVMAEKKPSWLHRCEQCLACIQWCPQQAIQYGKKTPYYPRYHNPEIKISDIIACTPNRKEL
jgi:ferredoxin